MPAAFRNKPGVLAFLLAIVMTVLLHDAKRKAAPSLDPKLHVHELVYADDTLLLATSAHLAEEYMGAVQRAGLQYGLQFNWRKIEVLTVGVDACLSKPDGSPVPQRESMVYLGSAISDDGKIGSELSRRLGAARAEFDKLTKVWNHSTLTQQRKIRIFESCVVSKLLYCLHTAYLNKQENRRLDAFQARCLRKILRIPHSYISRVPNAVVLQRSGARLLSNSLLRKQLTFLGHVARKPGDDAVRLTVFQPFSHLLAEPPENRKRGRPRKTWPQEIYRHACAAAGGVEALPALLRNTAQSATAWLSAVHTYCDAV